MPDDSQTVSVGWRYSREHNCPKFLICRFGHSYCIAFSAESSGDTSGRLILFSWIFWWNSPKSFVYWRHNIRILLSIICSKKITWVIYCTMNSPWKQRTFHLGRMKLINFTMTETWRECWGLWDSLLAPFSSPSNLHAPAVQVSEHSTLSLVNLLLLLYLIIVLRVSDLRWFYFFFF